MLGTGSSIVKIVSSFEGPVMGLRSLSLKRCLAFRFGEFSYRFILEDFPM